MVRVIYPLSGSVKDDRGKSGGSITISSHFHFLGLRKIADYDIDEEIGEPVASLKIEEGRAFLSAMKDYLCP